MTCCDCRREGRQTNTILWRIRKTLSRDVKSWFRICLFPVIVSFSILIIVEIYNPARLSLQSTSNAFVTSTTPNATQNYFYEPSSGFSTELALRNCTLNKWFNVGLVKSGGEGDAILDSIFNEISGAFRSAHQNDSYTLVAKDFSSKAELEAYVKQTSYRKDGLCFNLQWGEFNKDTSTFTMNFGFNFGDLYETRRPQVDYLYSTYSQLFVGQWGNTGFLQLMTTTTNKIISDVYKLPANSYNFQLMYMPLDTNEFLNDGFGFVVVQLMPIVFLAVARLPEATISQSGHIVYEGEI